VAADSVLNRADFALCLAAAGVFSACAPFNHRGLDARHAFEIERTRFAKVELTPDLEGQILALDPEHVTQEDVSRVLSRAPAPRIINIHGALYPVARRMASLSKFLVGMGYPESSIRSPVEGHYSFSCFEGSEKLAGIIAWYYEHDGLRPMMVGHSEGGIRAVRVLHQLAGHLSNRLWVWNPLLWRREDRDQIVDPLTGAPRSVIGLQVSYAAAMGAGGLARLVPSEWDLNAKLRSVPDSVEEFTGFYGSLDLLGGDFLGFGSANHFTALGRASVRSIRLPLSYWHDAMPETRHLAESNETRRWIDAYEPRTRATVSEKFEADSSHIFLAADIWHSVKRHWVLELQRLIRARRR
jgi:hypothetical protein